MSPRQYKSFAPELPLGRESVTKVPERMQILSEIFCAKSSATVSEVTRLSLKVITNFTSGKVCSTSKEHQARKDYRSVECYAWPLCER